MTSVLKGMRTRTPNAHTGAPKTPSFEFRFATSKTHAEMNQSAESAIIALGSTVGDTRNCLEEVMSANGSGQRLRAADCRFAKPAESRSSLRRNG